MSTEAPLDRSTEHLDEGLIGRYVNQPIGQELSDKVEDHCAVCDDCQKAVSIALEKKRSAMTGGLTSLVSSTSTPPDLDEDTSARPSSERFHPKVLIAAEGSGARVYKAFDTKMRREVVIKEFGLGQKDQAKKEVKYLSKAGPERDVVGLYELIEEGQSIQIVMEHLPGGTLEDLLSVPMTPRRAVRIMIPIADAVQALCDRALSTRDLKPANIVFAQDDRPRLIDFSIAQAYSERDPSDSSVPGTVHYLAPERIAGGSSNIDASTEVWSLGVIFYQMLTGKLPFAGGTIKEIVEQIQTKTLPPLKEYGELGRICLKCLSRDKSARYRSPAKFAEALEEWQSSFGASYVFSVIVGPIYKKWQTSSMRAKVASIILLTLVLTCSVLTARMVVRNTKQPAISTVVTEWPKIVKTGEHLVLRLTARNSLSDLDTCLIQPGSALAIEGSGALKFNEGQGIIAEGQLEIIGQDDGHRILLTRAVASKPWNGIALMGPKAGKSLFKHATIEEARGFLSAFSVDPRLSTSPDGYVAPTMERIPEYDKRKHQFMQRRGGGMMLETCDEVQFDDVIFRKNDTNQGGAIYLYSTRNVHMFSCQFIENRAGHNALGPGGAVFAQNSKDFILRDCVFLRNRAAGETYSCGGAIYSGINNQMEVHKTRFVDNFCRYVGGAIYCLQSEVRVAEKDAKKNGSIVNLPPASLRLNECQFVNNSTAFWKWHVREGYAAGNDLFVNTGYSANINDCTFKNLYSPGPLIVGCSDSKNLPCGITISESTTQASERPAMIFPNWAHAAEPKMDWPKLKSHDRDEIRLEGHEDFTPDGLVGKELEIRPLPLPATLYKKGNGTRMIDTIVVHFASASEWDKADDKSFNDRTRGEAVRDYPELEKMTPEERTFSVPAVIAIFKAYKVSSHFVIDRGGHVYELVPITNVAWHAGESQMPKQFDPSERKGVNAFSIGIELIATDPKDDPRVLADLAPGVDSKDLKGPNPAYTIAQYRALRRLIHRIQAMEGVDIRCIVGHDEIAPGRKTDPGPLFDWSVVRDKDGVPFLKSKK